MMERSLQENTEVLKHKSLSLKDSIGAIEGILDDARAAEGRGSELLDNIIQLPSVLPGTSYGEIILGFGLLQLADLQVGIATSSFLAEPFVELIFYSGCD